MGRGRRVLLVRPAARRRTGQHRLADGVGGSRPYGGRRSRSPGRRTRHCLPDADAAGARAVGRGALHRGRLPAGVLPPLPRLPRLLPALGTCPLPQLEAEQRSDRVGRSVTILAVTGLLAEAVIARRAGLQAICAGGRPERTAAALADALVAAPHPPHALLSFGIAGGLDPALSSGAVIAASAVLVEGRRVAATWRLPVGESRDIAAEPAIVQTAAAKAAL